MVVSKKETEKEWGIEWRGRGQEKAGDGARESEQSCQTEVETVKEPVNPKPLIYFA